MADQTAFSSEGSTVPERADTIEPDGTADIAAATGLKRCARLGPEMIKQAIDDGIDLLLDHLRERAKSRPNGVLTVDDLCDEAAAFKAQPSAAAVDLYRGTWQAFVEAVESGNCQKQRTRPLERLILNCFAHLLPPTHEAPVPGKHLSRRMVEPFIDVLQQLLGAETFELYQRNCQRMLQRLQRKRGPEFSWDLVAREPTGQSAVNDILFAICHHFTDIDARRRWMIEHISQALPPAETAAERQWQFGDREFHMLMDALYLGLRNALSSDAGKQTLVKRYSGKNVALLYTMLQALDRDYMDAMREVGAD